MGVTLFTAASAVALLVLLRRHYCTRCINFGCPLNNIPSQLKTAYLNRNPAVKKAWEDSG
jgi:hypothetical protein